MAIDNDRLRSLPSVNKVMQRELLEHATSVSRAALLEAVREEIDRLRSELRRGVPIDCDPDAIALRALLRAKAAMDFSPRKVVNATGVVLHTNLGRAALASDALTAMQAASSYCDLEYELERGARGDRYVHVETLLCKLTGAEAALAVNNNAGAVLLALSALTSGREVIVSRGELVEIGGSFRVPDIMAQSGTRLIEVGTTNRTRLADYTKAITPDTAMLLKVHPSNYRMVGFTESVDCGALSAVTKEHGVLLYYDAGSGLLVDLEPHGLRAEPTVQSLVASGCDLVSFSGDKLLGGPQAGLLVGKRPIIESLRQHPLYRALRPDKVTLGALSATLRIYAYGDPLRQIPVLRMLSLTKDELLERAHALRRAITDADGSIDATVKLADSTPGGGSYPAETIESAVVALGLRGLKPGTIADRMRANRPPVIGRVIDGEFIIDPRTLVDGDEPIILKAIERMAEEADRGFS